ncbi:MAG TPA: DUF2946 family protein [Burkholderiaceae bacterium]|nr:DUF2946 family protein [Burkholderiaceae bacterium]
MDEQVIAAMARWPNVPDVFGWLSLNEQGQWRLHPAGDALENDAMPAASGHHAGLSRGVPMASPRINQFINRNYTCDEKGRWYFQNGPQRVFVRLDVAPLILHTTDVQLSQPQFLSHNGLRTSAVTRWCIDSQGRLFADTDRGPGLIAGRDLEQVLGSLRTDDGRDVADVIAACGFPPDGAIQSSNSGTTARVDAARALAPAARLVWGDTPAVPLYFCGDDQVAGLFGYVRFPGP